MEEGREWKDLAPILLGEVKGTKGAVPREGNKEILDDEDEVLVYYGAADSAVAVATAKVADLIPEEFRIANWL